MTLLTCHGTNIKASTQEMTKTMSQLFNDIPSNRLGLTFGGGLTLVSHSVGACREVGFWVHYKSSCQPP